MALTPTEQAAADRAAALNPNRYDAVTNPTGLAGLGFQFNWTQGLNDTATLVGAALRLAGEASDDADTASAAAGTATTAAGAAVAAGARFLEPAAALPTTRDDGSALQDGDQILYTGGASPAPYTWQGGAWRLSGSLDAGNYVPSSRQVLPGSGLTGGGDLSADRTLSLTGQAAALHALASSGIIARTGSGTVAARTITAGAGVTVIDGDGVAGNPVISATPPGLVLLSTQTVTTPVAAVDFTGIDGTYDEYELRFYNVKHDNASARIQVIQVSANNGSSFLAAGSYSSQAGAWDSNTIANDTTGDAAILSTTTGVGSGGTLFGVIHMTGFTDTWRYFASSVTRTGGSTPTGTVMEACGGTKTATTVNAVRFKFNSANISSGTFRLYGVRKS